MSKSLHSDDGNGSHGKVTLGLRLSLMTMKVAVIMNT